MASTMRIRAKKPCVGRQRVDFVSRGSASCQAATMTNRDQQRGEAEERHPDAVDAQFVPDAEVGDPGRDSVSW